MVSTTRNDFASGEPSGFNKPRRISIAGVSVRRSPWIALLGSVKVSSAPSPDWRTLRSVKVLGIGGDGGTGSPGGPDPTRAHRKNVSKIRAWRNRRSTLHGV